MTPDQRALAALRAILDAKGPRDETARNPHEVGAGITNADAPRLPPSPEPAPLLAVYAYGKQVTEADVLVALRCLGDDALHDYQTGTLSRDDAYQVARRRMRELAQRGIT
jgi:uncharacterized protein YjiS (DUF1127 family)